MSTRNRSPVKGVAATRKEKEAEAARAAAKARALRKTNSPVKEPKVSSDNEFIRCELCRHMLDNPKSLVCMHSFCKECLLTYVRETTDKNAPNSMAVVCPICRQTTASTKSEKSLDKWIATLPTNEFLRSYLEAVYLKDPKRKCDTCRRQNKTDLAMQWCSSCHDALCDECVGFHNALKTTTGHQLVQLSKLRSEPIENIISMPLCHKHGGENVTQYCGKHREVLCEKCVAESHKTCVDVKPLKEAASRNKLEMNNVNKLLSDETNLAQSIQENRANAEQSINEDQDSVLEKIYEVRKRINENLAKCEAQIIDELGDVHGREKATIAAETKEAQRLKKSSGNLHGLVTSSEKFGTESHVLQNLQPASRQSEVYRDRVSLLNSRIRNTKINFFVDPTLEKLMRGINRLGELKVTSSSAQLPTSHSLKASKSDSDPEDEHDMKRSQRILNTEPIIRPPAKPYLASSVNGRSPSDKEACWFTGIAYLPNGYTILVDRNNSKLKLFGSDFKIIAEQALGYQPFGITTVSSTDVAVTFPRENKINLYNVGTSFQLVKVIPTSDRGYGLTFADDRFVYACACASPPSIKITTKEGVEKHDLSPVDNMIPMFLRPWYVKVNQTGSLIYVSDCHRCHVTCISGTVIKQFTYKDASLNSPRGLHVTKDGRIIVCGFGTDNVQLLSRDGVYICDLLTRGDDIIGPQEVSLNLKEDRMILTFDPSSGKSDLVHIYRIGL